MLRIIVFVALFGLAMPGAAADIYRWTGKDGEVHYGQAPPSGVEYEGVDPGTRPVDDSSSQRPDEYDRSTDSADSNDFANDSTSSGPRVQAQGEMGPSEAECNELRRKIKETQGGERRILPDRADRDSKRGKFARQVGLAVAKDKLRENCN